MRDVTDEFRLRLDCETTSLCHCWKILRRDGAVQGFTEHDGDIVFDGVTFAADTGLQNHGQEARIGLSGGTSDVSGALTQLSVDEATLAGGLLDGASLETWLVDWARPDCRLLVNVEIIGDVERGENSFSARLQSRAEILGQETGRRFLKCCSADLGDARCGVRLDVPRYRMQALVAQAQDAGRFAVTLAGVEDNWFAGGRFRILSGAQQGVTGTIRAHRQTDGLAHLSLWTPLGARLQRDDRIEVQAGCDKSFVTCGEKFANRVNFRGFPHIPGNDVLMALASAETVMDGGSLFK